MDDSAALDAHPGPVTLSHALATLGDDLLRELSAGADPTAVVRAVAIFDAAEQGELPERSLVLGVGVDAGSVAGVLDQISGRDAVALVLRLPIDLDDDVLALADKSGVCLLGLNPAVGWHQLTTLLDTVLGRRSSAVHDAQTLGGFAGGDLFGLANAICALIDAPVTIEDRDSSVLAFSDRQDEADHIRIETILDRRVPDVYMREDEARGVPLAIQQSTEPLFLRPMEIGDLRTTMPRIVVAVRAGDEFLGTIWAVVREPLGDDKNRLLVEASRLVALHLLQMRTETDIAQRVRTNLIVAALEGGPGGRDALLRLNLADCPVVVLALTAQDVRAAEDPRREASSAAMQQRVAAAFALHLAATWPGAAVAIVNALVLALVPARRTRDADAAIARTCQQFLRHRTADTRLHIGIGRVCSTQDDLPRSRIDAERTVRLLAAALPRLAIARAVDVQVDALLQETRNVAAADGLGPSGAYARLLAHDDSHNAAMITTLRAWLDAHGDITRAAAATHVHPNTFRYRLKRLGEIGEFDLDDPDERFALNLQLRLFPPNASA